MSYDWDFSTAEKELKTALDLNPNYSTAHEWYAHLLMVEGRYDELWPKAIISSNWTRHRPFQVCARRDPVLRTQV